MKSGVLAIAFLLLAAPVAQANHKKPKNSGKVSISINIQGARGHSLTDGDGIDYVVGGKVIGHEDKVYPVKYWGVFPLFYFGDKVGAHVGISNTSRRSQKFLVHTEQFSLLVNGHNGGALAPAKWFDLTIPRGKTQAVDASFVGVQGPGVVSGLDRFVVTVEQGGKVIAVREGIFCPPEWEEFAAGLP